MKGQLSTLLTLMGVAALAVLCPLGASAQFNSLQGSVNLQAVLVESLTVAANAGTVNFTLTAGSAANPGDVTVTITTTWALVPSRASLTIYAYFDSPTAALTNVLDNTVVIPATNVQGSVNAGAFSAFTQNTPFGALHGLQIGPAITITGANRSGTRGDTLALNIDLSVLLIAAGDYTGTLRVQAQAI